MKRPKKAPLHPAAPTLYVVRLTFAGDKTAHDTETAFTSRKDADHYARASRRSYPTLRVFVDRYVLATKGAR